jgi:hypothetical protein
LLILIASSVTSAAISSIILGYIKCELLLEKFNSKSLYLRYSCNDNDNNIKKI